MSVSAPNAIAIGIRPLESNRRQFFSCSIRGREAKKFLKGDLSIPIGIGYIYNGRAYRAVQLRGGCLGKPNAMLSWIRFNWRFTSADVRIKLKRLYPVLEKECSEA